MTVTAIPSVKKVPALSLFIFSAQRSRLTHTLCTGGSGTEDSVHWEPFLHAWVGTRYPDVGTVLLKFSADRTPTQMLFLDRPAHTRLRSLAAQAFTPARLEVLPSHIRDSTNTLDAVQDKGRTDVIADLAEPRMETD